jgi:hypothetical protein
MGPGGLPPMPPGVPPGPPPGSELLGPAAGAPGVSMPEFGLGPGIYGGQVGRPPAGPPPEEPLDLVR